MLANGINRNCGFEDEIVSYIYDELTAGDRQKFERHLVSCTTCTDEFAAVSYSRFSVFEWQKNEFAPLKTPEIGIPYLQSRREHIEGTKTKFLAGFGELLGSLNLAFAAIAFVFGGSAFFLVNYTTSQRVAKNVETNNASLTPSSDTVANVIKDRVDELPPDPVTLPVGGGPKDATTIRPVIVRDVRRLVRPRSPVSLQNSNNFATRHLTNQKMKNAPVLTYYEDNDDKSLRLADLFDSEVGMKR
jgi:hypothetical protein